jgi:sporulation protein YlmC with PRC-barrel domain
VTVVLAPKRNTLNLRRTKDLSQYTIAAIDTDIGNLHDLYFDDERWTIRYIVVATGVILPGRKVLISPVALRHPVWTPLHLHANLTWRQVEESPGIDLHQPVSRRHQAEHHKHYGWPRYWEGTNVWGLGLSPKELAEAPRTKKKTAVKSVGADTHLRSAREVTGYHIIATDGEIGHLSDFLFDDETWEIRYAIVDTKNWWPGKKVLIRPQWIKRISWADRELYANMSRASVRKSPKWNPRQPVSRDYELRLHQHYGFTPYWTTQK